jgi:Ser/Thr protein kinase RdoA (MazF antagonist)
MELAVCLSKYAGEKQEFIAGFAEHGQLTEQEISVIPDLINLRVLSNVVYFVGRALGKEDGIESLTTRAATYATRVEWINSKSQDIINLISAKMLKK